MSEINPYELYEKYNKSIEISLNSSKISKHTGLPYKFNNEFSNHVEKYNFSNFEYPGFSKWNQGQLFLYEEVRCPTSNKPILFYPKIAIYLNVFAADQTMGVEYVDYRRTWEDHRSYDFEYKGTKYLTKYNALHTIIRQQIFWGGEDLLIYGVWDKLPNFKTLKNAYENTWWFYRTIREKRDIKINTING